MQNNLEFEKFWKLSSSFYHVIWTIYCIGCLKLCSQVLILINRPKFSSGNVTWIHPFFFLSIAGNFLLGLIIYKWYCKLWGGLDLKWVLIWGQLCMPQLILIWIFERYKLDTSLDKCLQENQYIYRWIFICECYRETL